MFKVGQDPDPAQIDSREEFARQLTVARERAGLTVREVAKIAGIPGSTAGGFFSGRHVPALRPPDVLIRILKACGITDAEGVGQWLDAARRVRRVPGRRSAGRPVPYRGLAGFQVEDGEWFFGRERLVGELLGRLTAPESLRQPLMVIGPSGCGKSSLLRAGLVPALLGSATDIAACRPENVKLFTPGEAPVRSLVAQLVSAADDVDDIVRQVLREPPWLSRHRPWSHSTTIIVDQFEEIFTACTDDGQRRAFIGALAAMAADGDPPVVQVVIGMRADFYARAMRYRPLAVALQESQVLVGPMTRDEMRCAVLQPACRAGIDVEAGLVEVLLKDLERLGGAEGDSHDVGSLPLLSHALLVTWENGRGRELTVAGYRDTGGIRGAVAQSAERMFQDLSARQQEVARRLFVRLVHVRDDTPDTRRRVRHDELQEHDSDENLDEEADDLQVVLERYVCGRLITSDMDGLEIAHEALVSAWPRLRRWIDTDREGLAIMRRVTDGASAWEQGERDPGLLLSGVRLAQVREWFEKPGNTSLFTQLERSFVRACLDHELVQIKAVKRRRRILYEMVAALSVLATVLAMLTVYSVNQRREADHDRDLAVSRQFAGIAAQQRITDSALAAQFALAGYRIAPTAEARSALLDASATPLASRAIADPGVVMQAVSVTRNGRRMAVAGADGLVRLWDLALTGRPQKAGEPVKVADSPVYSVAFSPDGNVLATAGGDRKVRLWDVGEAGPPKPLSGDDLDVHANTVYAVAYSPTGAVLVSGGADAMVRFWDVSDPAMPAVLQNTPTVHAAAVHTVAINATGTLAASGSADGTVRLWDLTAAGGPRPVGEPIVITTRQVRALVFAPDAPMLAVGTSDRIVQVWDVADPAHPNLTGSPVSAPQSWIQSLAFSDRGDRLAAASSDNSLWVWDRALDEIITMSHPAPVTSVAFQPGNMAFVTAAADGIVRIWRLPTPVIRTATSIVATVAFDSAAKRLLTASGNPDSGIRLWSGTDRRRPSALGGKMTAVAPVAGYSGAAAISPNGELLAVSGVDGGIQLWDASRPPRPSFVGSIMDDKGKVIESIAFSPTGKIMAAGGDDNLIRLWSVENPQQPTLLATLTGPTALVLAVTFSSDGNVLAAGSADNTIRLWDVSDPTHPALGGTLAGPKSYVYSVTFSPNGAILAAGSADKTVRLWDISNLTDPQPIGDPLIGASNYVYTVSFSPDGGLLAAGSGDHDIRLWDVRTAHNPTLDATLTASDDAIWSLAFSADGRTLAATDSDGLLRTWTTDTQQAAKEICETIGDDITPAEWNQFAPSTRYDPPCAGTS